MSQLKGVSDAYRGSTRPRQVVEKRHSGPSALPGSERGKSPAIPSDRVGVSDLSRKMRIAMRDAASLPSENALIRKVAALGRAVRDGSYIINADKIAEKMLLSSLLYATDSPLIG